MAARLRILRQCSPAFLGASKQLNKQRVTGLPVVQLRDYVITLSRQKCSRTFLRLDARSNFAPPKSSRSFSTTTPGSFRGRRQIRVNPQDYSQQPQYQYQQYDPYVAQVMWYVNAVRATTVSVIAIFVAVYVGRNYAQTGSWLPQIAASSLPGMESRDYEVPQYGTRRSSEKLHQLKDYLSERMLSYRVRDWPPSRSVDSYAPYVFQIFSQPDLLNLGFQSFMFHGFAGGLMMRFGILKTLFTFVGSGFLASQLQCAVDQAYAMGRQPELFKYIKSTSRDPHSDQTLTRDRSGAGPANLALFAITALASSHARVGPIWVPGLIAGLLAALDSWAYYENLDDARFLAGMVSGAIFYFGWLRWTKLPARLRRPQF